jgi:hypothetical protein
MDNKDHDDGNIAKNGHVSASENNADWHWLDNAIYGSASGPLGFEEAYEMVPAKHQSIDELVKWVSDAIRYDTGLKLSRNQERIILQGFFVALRQRGFNMWQCPEEEAAKAS